MVTRERGNFLDISEHRKSLNRLEEDIERELAELQNLNKTSETMRRKFKHRLSEATIKEESSAIYQSNTIGLNQAEQIDVDKNTIPLDYFSLTDGEKRDELENPPMREVWTPVSQTNPLRNDTTTNGESKSPSNTVPQKNSLPKDIMEIVKQLEINGPPKSDPPKLSKPLASNEKKVNSKSAKPNEKKIKESQYQRKISQQNCQSKAQEITIKKKTSITPSKRASLPQNIDNFETKKLVLKTPEAKKENANSVQNQQTQDNVNGSINEYISLYQAEYGESNLNSERDPLVRSKSQNSVFQHTDHSPVMDTKFTSRNDLFQKNERVASAKHEISVDSFRPQINKKSLELASKMGDPFERLASINGERQKQLRKKAQQEMDRDLTFKPKINKSSEFLDENFKNNMFNGDQLYRWDQLYLMKDKYNIVKQMKKLELEKQLLENDECTFQPNTLLSKYHLHRSQNSTIAERSKMWEEQRQQKILKEKLENVDKELEGCTFKPQVTNVAKVKKDTTRFPNPSTDGLETALLVAGADRHFERIEKANRLKKEKENLLNHNIGSGWQYKRTVPKEPKLGRFSHHLSSARLNSLSPAHNSSAMSSNYASKKDRIHQEEYENFSYLREQLSKSPNQASASHKNNRPVHVELEQEEEEQFTTAIAQLHSELHQIRF